MSRSALFGWVEEQSEAAARSLSAQTGDRAICEMHKDGRVTGGLKYDEGRLVALNAVRRIIAATAADNRPATEVAAELAAERARWRNQLADHQARKRPALPWVAYFQGGDDAITAALEFVALAPAALP